MSWPKMVEVTWKDCCMSDWQDAKPALITMRTVGYVIEENEEYIAIAKEQNDNPSYRHLSTIPKSGIVEIKQLRTRRSGSGHKESNEKS